MKKTVLLALLALCIASVANAKSLVLQLTDSTKIYYLLGGETNPVLKMVDGEVYVNADQYAFSNVDKFYVSQTDDPNTAISGVPGGKSHTMANGILYVQGTGNVRLYAADGRLLSVPVTTADGITAVDANQLPSGTYVLTVNGKSVKFLKH